MDQNRLSRKGGNLLPEGWAETTLSDIAAVNPKNGELNSLLSGFIPMALAPTDFNGHLEFEEREWDEIKKKYTHFANGDVIFAKVTPCFENGKAAIVSDLPNGIGAGSSEFYVLRPLTEGISASYIFANIKSHEFMQTGAENMTGAGGLRRVPRKFVEGFKVNLPPQAEQKVIADKLDTLLAQVETTKARLDRIPQILKTFRQSVLSAAVSGKLTEEWRKNSGMKSNHYSAAWKWTPMPERWSVKEYADVVVSRLGKMLDKAKNVGTATKYLGNINARWFEFDLKTTQEILATDSDREELSLKLGDVLICEGGEPGRCAIWGIKTKEPIVFQKALHRARVNDEIIPQWLIFNLKNDADSLILDQLFTGTTIKHLTGKALKKYPLRIPPIEEQTEIVRQAEQQVKAAQQRVNKLTQSILAKAFRGELTAQWRRDNPDLLTGDNSAEALLAKIKSAKEALKPIKKVRKKKVII
jgi:type I restriction enzyme S subunit